MEPNFVLMTLPEETGVEFVEILPFTPANRNNLIGWIAGRSDGEHYGTLVVYNFPKTKLVDGPLQVEARIDQNSQLSGQFSLWNQQGSRVVRGGLLVIPVGRACSTRSRSICRRNAARCPSCASSSSPCRIGSPTARHSKPRWPGCSAQRRDPQAGAAPAGDAAASGARAANNRAADLDVAHPRCGARPCRYQRLTAEGKLGEAGQRLEGLKQKLEQLQRERR